METALAFTMKALDNDVCYNREHEERYDDAKAEGVPGGHSAETLA